jgi:ABC-2 type transport system permease protein
MLSRRFIALFIKESIELIRDRQLIIFITVIPIISMVVFGYVLHSNVAGIRLGILDQSQDSISRELIDGFANSKIFATHKYTNRSQDLTHHIKVNKIDSGLIIPPNLAKDIYKNGTSNIGVQLDGSSSYSSGLAKGYIAQIVRSFNINLLKNKNFIPKELEFPIQMEIVFRYNSGMRDSWFFVPGVIAATITINSVLEAAIEGIREKDQGTLEQLLMVPVSSTAILFAKIFPISGMLTATLIMCLIAAHSIFHLPMRGNLFLLLLFSIIYVQIGVSIGLLIAAPCKNKLQTILVGIFLVIPIILLGGAVTSVNSMPLLFRWIAQVNPLYHYLIILRGILLKGTGLGVWWLHAIVIVFYSMLALILSIRRYRKQLS